MGKGKKRKVDQVVSDAMARWGAKGGKQSAQRLTPEQRKERARKAIETRWRKKREGTS